MPSDASVWTIVVAGGSGLRFGGRKQFADLAGRSVLDYSLVAAATVSDGVIVVVPPDAVEELGRALAGSAIAVVAGGATRAASVRAGLAAVPDRCNIVLVHDAARPLATAALFRSVVDAVQSGADAVVPAVAVVDTIRTRSGAVIDRDELLAVQTPQGFVASTLRRAHLSGREATDDATLVEADGGTVTVIDGEPTNRKITDPPDLRSAAALLEEASLDS